MSLKTIVDVLGGELYDRGCRANIPAPGHSANDRSVSLMLKEGRIIVHTFGDGDWRTVLDHLREHGLVDAQNAPTSVSTGKARAAFGVVAASDIERLAAARRIWQGGRALRGSLSERHCRLRHIERALPGPEIARHNSETPVSAYGDDRLRRPALLVGVTDGQGVFTAVEVTYLAPNGRRAIDLRLSRKTVGPVPPGTAVRIDPAAPEMLVAEGFFTTLSATECFALPGWALMSTRNLRSWSAPQGVRFVMIAADRGKDGEASAEVLRSRLARQGVRSQIALPPEPHGDWNEAARPV
ncbi:MAG TPA: toprim domain-containing protein [Caulobacteraceae bacterium]|nr:toprim domain-containing protein [Caulobacteraceae bacterium]